jgi:glycerol uptake facilitator protein
MDMTLVRRLLAELAGTATLCLFGIGAAVSVAAAGRSVAWSQLLAYVVGPIVGGLIAAFLHDYLAAARRPAVGCHHRAGLT